MNCQIKSWRDDIKLLPQCQRNLKTSITGSFPLIKQFQEMFGGIDNDFLGYWRFCCTFIWSRFCWTIRIINKDIYWVTVLEKIRNNTLYRKQREQMWIQNFNTKYRGLNKKSWLLIANTFFKKYSFRYKNTNIVDKVWALCHSLKRIL